MGVDPFYSMPTENWQQVGSFFEPVEPPIDGPDGGTLVALPCINEDWLPLLLGAADQLRNPSTWDPTLSDSARALVISRADKLRSMLSRKGPCVNPVVGASFDSCVLNLHLADGSTVAVTNWAAQFCTCVQGCIVAPTPPNPNGALKDQHACNIAGFLAQELIHVTCDKMISYLGTSHEQVQFALDVLGGLSFAFPITYQASQALYQVYQDVVSELSSQVSAAASDPTLLADVTCTIFTNIRSDGFVTAGNFSLVQAALHAMSYTYAWTPNALGNFWGELGLVNVQAWQNIGAMDDVDCSACATSWCYYFDFTVTDGGFTIFSSGYPGTYVAGVGWETTFAGGLLAEMVLIKAIPTAVAITEIQVNLSSTQGATGIHGTDVQIRSGTGTVVSSCGFSYPANSPAYAWQSILCAGNGDHILADIATSWASGAGKTIMSGLQVRGTGVNPFGSDNCIVGP